MNRKAVLRQNRATGWWDLTLTCDTIYGPWVKIMKGWLYWREALECGLGFTQRHP